ncbi:MAG: hypothetical protein ABI988_15775 [Nitrospirota bacterium]
MQTNEVYYDVVRSELDKVGGCMKPSRELVAAHRKVAMQADGFSELEQRLIPGRATLSGGHKHRTPPSGSRARAYDN